MHMQMADGWVRFHIPCSSCPFPRRIRDSGGVRQRVCSQHLDISSFHPLAVSLHVCPSRCGLIGRATPVFCLGQAKALRGFRAVFWETSLASCYELLWICPIVTRLCQCKGLPGDSSSVATFLQHFDSLVYCAETFWATFLSFWAQTGLKIIRLLRAVGFRYGCSLGDLRMCRHSREVLCLSKPCRQCRSGCSRIQIHGKSWAVHRRKLPWSQSLWFLPGSASVSHFPLPCKCYGNFSPSVDWPFSVVGLCMPSGSSCCIWDKQSPAQHRGF